MTVENSTQLDPIGQGTLTEQTTEALLEAVFDGRFPNRRLPPEPDLASILNVSRTTIRAALQALERLGMVSRTPGRGTIILPHVSRHSIALQRLIGFSTLLRERYTDVSVEERHWVEDQPSALAAEAMGVPNDTAVVKTSKLYVADGQPAIHIRDEIPLSHFRQSDQADLRAGTATAMLDSIFSLSKSWSGHEIHHTVVELVSEVAPADPSFPLALEPGAPFLTLQETHYTVLGEAVAYSTVLIDDRYLRLQVVRHS
jgi:GntR family transcriptional regulator